MPSWERRRRTFRATSLAVLSLALCLGVSGCTPQDPAPITPPSPSAVATTAVVLPTNEEALAIVEELVPRFMAAEADAFQSGSYTALEELASEAYVEEVRQGAATLETNGQRITGDPTVSGFKVQSVQDDQGRAVISAYACQDISAVDVVDAAGNNVQPPGIRDRSTMVYKLISSGETFIVEGVEPWSGEGTC